MERISVDVGQFVLTGEPVAVMGDGSQVSAAVGRVQATGALRRVPQGRHSDRSQPLVGGKRRRKGSRMMRKTSLILLGALAGAAVTLLATQPLAAGRIGCAKRRPPTLTGSSTCSATCSSACAPTTSRSPTTPSWSNRPSTACWPGSIRIRATWTRRASATCRCRPAASSAASASRSPWRTAWSRSSRRSTIRRPPRPASWPTTSSPSSTTSRCRA